MTFSQQIADFLGKDETFLSREILENKVIHYLMSGVDSIEFLSDDKKDVLLKSFFMPWRQDQLECISNFRTFYETSPDNSIFYIQAVFGCGKTTLLKAFVYIMLLSIPEIETQDILVSAYNTSIRDELREEFKKIKNNDVTVTVKTFDSIIHEINQKLGSRFGYDDSRFFSEKRKEVYTKMYKCPYERKDKTIRYIFIDEAQDLDQEAIEVFSSYYPNAKIVLMGDIFQSIQKEVKESVLYRLLTCSNSNNNEIPHTIQLNYEFFHEQPTYIERTAYCNELFQTPRVPPQILDILKEKYNEYYENRFESTISRWESTSNIVDEGFHFIPFHNFKNVCTTIVNEHLTDQHKIKNTMILTYTSEFTVGNNCGDIHRIKQQLKSQFRGLPINMKYKQKEDDKLFITTMQSSKGLERDHVIVIISDNIDEKHRGSLDVIMNLLGVAFSRTKKTLYVYYNETKSKISPLFQKLFLGVEDIIEEPHEIINTLLTSHHVDNVATSDILPSSIFKKLNRSMKYENLREHHPLLQDLNEQQHFNQRDGRNIEEMRLREIERPNTDEINQVLSNKEIFYLYLIQEMKQKFLQIDDSVTEKEEMRLEGSFSNFLSDYNCKKEEYNSEISQLDFTSLRNRDGMLTKFRLLMKFYVVINIPKKRSIITELPDPEHFVHIYNHPYLRTNFRQINPLLNNSFLHNTRENEHVTKYSIELVSDFLVKGIASLIIDHENFCEIVVIDSQRLVKREERSNRPLINSAESLYKETALLRGFSYMLSHVKNHQDFTAMRSKQIIIKIMNIYERKWYTYNLDETNPGQRDSRHHYLDFMSVKKGIREALLFENLKFYLKKNNKKIEQEKTNICSTNLFVIDGEYDIDIHQNVIWKRLLILKFNASNNFFIYTDKKVYRNSKIKSADIDNYLSKFFKTKPISDEFLNYCLIEKTLKKLCTEY